LAIVTTNATTNNIKKNHYKNVVPGQANSNNYDDNNDMTKRTVWMIWHGWMGKKKKRWQWELWLF